MALSLRFDAKQPGDLDAFTLDFVGWLTMGDSITSASVSVTLADGSVGDISVVGSPTISGTQVSAWLSGGTSGNDYIVNYTVNTADGRLATRSAHLYCGLR